MTAAVLFGLLSGASFGLASVLVKLAVRWTKVAVVVIWTQIVSTLLFGLVWLLRAVSGGPLLPPPEATLMFMLAGVFSMVFGRTSLFLGVRHMGASRSSAFRIASPVVTFTLAALLLGERLAWIQALGMLVVVAGLLLISLEGGARAQGARGELVPVAAAAAPGEVQVLPAETGQTLPSETAGSKARDSGQDARETSPAALGTRTVDWRGIALGLGIAASFGTGDIFRKWGTVFYQDPVAGTLFGSLAALLVYSVYMAASGQFREVVAIRREGLLPVLGIGVSTSVAVSSFFLSVQTLPVSVVTPLAGTQSLFAMLFSLLFNRTGELITWKLVVSVLVVLAGVVALVSAA